MIRTAQAADIEKIVQLIQPYIKDFAIDSQGEDKFNAATIAQLLSMPTVEYFIFEQNKQLMGVIAYRQPAHLLHFFVDQQFQQQGTGRSMWQWLEHKIRLNSSIITVNSSCYAQSIYEKFGFHAISTAIEAQGLRYVPMQKLYP